MQYTIEFLDLWAACLAAAMKDRSLAFPISIVIGALAGGLCWWLAALSARLWNKRFYMKIGLQVLCGIAALLAVILALTYASSKNMEDAVKVRLQQWKRETVNDQEWARQAFCEAWDAVARAGQEPDVRLSPSPRTDPSLNTMSMGSSESKKAVVRTYVDSALTRFRKDRPYLTGILNPTAEIPEELMNISLVSWFRDHPGQPYPLEEGVVVVASMLEEGATQQTETVAAYTRRLSLALFIISQLIVFAAIAFFANRSNRPSATRRD